MRPRSILTLLVVSFLLGWTLHMSSIVSSTHLSNPLSNPDMFGSGPTAPPFFSIPLAPTVAAERPSPTDFLTEEHIQVFNDHVIISGSYAYVKFLGTNSMDPVLDENTLALQRRPQSPSELQVGDIIAYIHPEYAFPIVHRIVAIDTDDDGWYCITRGDNLAADDPAKVRFPQITGAIVALFY